MADLIKIGILGEQDAFVVQDEQARNDIADAILRISSLEELFPLGIRNGGTGGTTLDDARAALEIEYDALLLKGKYPGRNLESVFADEISDYTDEAEWFNARVIAGNFTGIRPKDYFDITLTDGKVFRYRVMGFDHDLNAIDSEVVKHHVDMCPDQVWPDSVVWNSTNTNQGTSSEKRPYLASNLHSWEINTFYPLLPSKWRNVIANRRVLLEERYSSSSALTASTGWSWADMGKIWSLSETEVYGQCVWGTKGYSVGCDSHYSLFFPDTASRIRRNHSDSRYSWWLRSASGRDSANVCFVTSNGNANTYAASYAGIRALPCFRVGV